MSENLNQRPLSFCCGMAELGNFNYDDPKGTPEMTHFHKVGSSWKTQDKHAPHTTEKQIRDYIANMHVGGIMCSTGAGQEYLEPILEKVGFKKVFSFINPGHARTPVHVWCYSKHEITEKK